MRPVKNLLRKERLLTLVRAHEVQAQGYNVCLWEGEEQFPLVMTIFSAPNYCGSYQNRAAVAISNMQDQEQLQIRQFDPTTELTKPYQLPNDMDCLEWSAPFLAECVSKMFFALLSRHNTIYDATKENLDEEEFEADKIKALLRRGVTQQLEKKKQVEVIRHKIRAVGRLSRVWQIHKENRQLILNLKEMCPDGKIPPGTLIEGRKGITDKLKQFLFMRDIDRENEKWKGPRKYTLGRMPSSVTKSDPLAAYKNAAGAGVPPRAYEDVDGVLAAENYDALKTMMAK